MFLFQTMMKAPLGNSSDLQTAAKTVIDAFKRDGGYSTISNMPKETLASVLRSTEFWHALRFPDLLPKNEQKAFADNMLALGKTDFAGLVRDVYGQKESGALRLLFNDLYHSDVGKKAVEGGLGAVFGLQITLAGMNVPDEEMRKEFAYSKYSEAPLSLGNLTQAQIDAYRKLEAYMRNGDDAKGKEFFEFASKNYKDVSALLRTQEVRGLADDALKTKDGADRVKEFFLSSDCRAAISDALWYPEGINLVGYLWNTQNGRKFMSAIGIDKIKTIGALLVTPPVLPVALVKVGAYLLFSNTKDVAAVVGMIMEKQGKYDEKYKIPRQEEYRRIYESELAAKQTAGKTAEKKVQEKPLKSVPVLLHKKEFDAVIRGELPDLKKKYQGKTPDAVFEKIAIDSFERFYYDCNGLKAGKESRSTREAREIIRKEYSEMQEDLKPAFLLEGTRQYLELGMEKARQKIAASGETGFF